MEHLELLPKETCMPISSYFLYHPTVPLLESASMGLLTPDTAYKPNQTMYGPLSIPELMTAELLPLWSVNQSDLWMGLLQSFTHKVLGAILLISLQWVILAVGCLGCMLTCWRNVKLFPQTVIPFYFPICTLDEADCDFSTPCQHRRLSLFI